MNSDIDLTEKPDLLPKNSVDNTEIDDDGLFDSLVEKIGNNGKFQKRFNILFNFLLLIFVTMPCFNIIIAMTIPDHSCHVPGRESSNYTEEEWKRLTIPK